MKAYIIEFSPFDFKANAPVLKPDGTVVDGTEVMFIVPSKKQALEWLEKTTAAGKERWNLFNSGKDPVTCPVPHIREFPVEEDAVRVYRKAV